MSDEHLDVHETRAEEIVASGEMVGGRISMININKSGCQSIVMRMGLRN